MDTSDSEEFVGVIFVSHFLFLFYCFGPPYQHNIYTDCTKSIFITFCICIKALVPVDALLVGPVHKSRIQNLHGTQSKILIISENAC